MAQLIELKTEKGTTILVESSRHTGGVQTVGAIDDTIKRIDTLLDNQLEKLVDVCTAFRQTLSKVGALKEAELEMGLQVTGKGTIYFAEMQAEAAFKVKIILDLTAGAAEP